MKILIITFLQLFQGDSTCKCQDGWDNSLKICYQNYLGMKPNERAIFLQNYVKTCKNIPVSYVSDMISDMNSVTSSMPNIDSDIGSFGGEFILKDTVTLINAVKLYQKKILDKVWLIHKSTLLNNSNSLKNKNIKISDYLKLTPYNRMLFLELNSSNISKEILLLIQQDLDSILEVKTPKINFKKKSNVSNMIKIYKTAILSERN